MLENKGGTKYKITVSCGSDTEGNRVRRTKIVHAKNKKEAWKLHDEFKVLAQKTPNHRLTFADLVTKWDELYAARQLESTTYNRYKELLDSRILPAIGHILLSDLCSSHLAEFYNLLASKPRKDGRPGTLAKQTIKHHHRLIHSILQKALEWELINKNPNQFLKPPSPVEQPVITEELIVKDVIMVDELQNFLAAVSNFELRNQVTIYLALGLGLRKSEIYGLQWDDIDFLNQSVTILRNRMRVDDVGIVVKKTKTKKSTRVISMPKFVFDKILNYKNHIEKRKKEGNWGNSKYVITTFEGNDICPSNLNQWYKRKYFKNHLKLDYYIKFHNLRHTHASLLIHQQADIATVSKRLGHSTVYTTLNTYTHMMDRTDTLASKKIDELLNSKTLT